MIGNETGPARKAGPAARFALAGILVAGALLRFQGIGFGLPQTNCRPDENHLVETACRAADGSLNPHYYRKPTLLIYADALLFRAASPALRQEGETFEQAEENAPGRFYLFARILSACLGTLTILLVHRLGARISGPAAGLAGSLLFAVAPLAMRDSHFATVDAALVFLLTAAMLPTLRFARTGSIRPAIAAAVLTGLASAVKYTGFVGLIPILAAAWTAPDPRTGRPARAIALAGVCLLAFFAGAPYVLLDWRDSLPTVSVFMQQMQSGHYGMSLGSKGWTWHPVWTLPLSLGAGTVLLSVVGIGAALPSIVRGGDRDRFLILLGVVGPFLVIGPQPVLFARYVLPMLPGLCLFAAGGAAFLAGLAGSPAIRAPLSAAIVLAAAAGPFGRSVQIDRLLSTEDTRLAARRWIEEEIPDGARVLLVRRIGWRVKSYGNPQISSGRIEVLEGLVASDPREGAPREPEADPMARGVTVVRAETLMELLEKARPDYLVLHRSPLTFYSIAAAAVDELARNGSLVHVEAPWAGPSPGRPPGSLDYDQQDAFFAPLRNFGGILRPGPEVLVFRMAGASARPSPGTE